MTKKRKRLFVFLGIISAVLTVYTVYCLAVGIASSVLDMRYATAFQDEATEYVRSSPEMIERYGTDFEVKMDTGYYFYEPMEELNKFPFAFTVMSFKDIFAPEIKKDPEEFYSEVKMIGYEFDVGFDRYRIEMRRDETGKFVPTQIYEVED